MQIGCGQTVKTIDENQYIYFWWYEYSSGRSVQKYAYVGRADDPDAKLRANRMAHEYYVKSRKTLDKLIAATR